MANFGIFGDVGDGKVGEGDAGNRHLGGLDVKSDGSSSFFMMGIKTGQISGGKIQTQMQQI